MCDPMTLMVGLSAVTGVAQVRGAQRDRQARARSAAAQQAEATRQKTAQDTQTRADRGADYATRSLAEAGAPVAAPRGLFSARSFFARA